jgi:hypothetical protein
MWCRVVEVTIGCWLAMSPFIFRHPPGEVSWWANDWACAVAIMVLALLSFRQGLRHIHLLNCIVAIWLIAWGYLHGREPVPPALQNDVLVGWLLGMFAILPSEAELPPKAWEDFYARQRS